jgi:hypothetical protein
MLPYRLDVHEAALPPASDAVGDALNLLNFSLLEVFFNLMFVTSTKRSLTALESGA